MWQRMREAWRQAREQAMTKYMPAQPATTSADAAAFLEEVFSLFPYTPEAMAWLRASIQFQVQDLQSTRGGGYWDPSRNLVFLYTAQYEAAIHELAHAWWHTRRIGHEQHMIDVTVALSEERDLRFQRMQRLAYGYIHGIPEQNWAGMLVERNDWEMYAGLASGMMADMRLLPLYARPLYEGLLYLLPDDAPSPAQLAPHG